MVEPFIGKKLSVIKAANKSYESITGMIIDETKNTFVIDIGKSSTKTILKKGCLFEIDGRHVDGEKITKRIEDRLKKRRIK